MRETRAFGYAMLTNTVNDLLEWVVRDVHAGIAQRQDICRTLASVQAWYSPDTRARRRQFYAAILTPFWLMASGRGASAGSGRRPNDLM